MPFLMYAQPKLSKDFTVTTAAPFPVVDAGNKEYFSDGTHVVSVKTRGQNVTIQKFSIDGMKEVTRKVYEEWPPYLKVQSVLKMKGKLYYIYASYDKKGKYNTIYSREINTDDLSLGAEKMLFKSEKKIIPSGGTGGGFMGMSIGGTMVKVFKSFDESKILLSFRNAPKERDDRINFDVLGFYVFDHDLEKEWGGNVKMPYTEKVMNNLAYGIDKDGNAYMLAYIVEKKKFELFSIDESAELTTHEMDVDGTMYFSKMDLFENSAGNLVVAGLYSNGLDFKMSWSGTSAFSANVNGIVQYTITKEGEVLSTYNMEFPIKLINMYKSARAKASNERRESKGKAGIADLRMQNIVTDDNGSTVFLAEQHFTKRVRSGNSYKTYYYYRDMVITKIDKAGTVLWQKKVPKSQMGTTGKGGMGVAYVRGKDAHYLLYLDNVKNANLPLSKVPAQHQDGRGGFLTAYKIDDATGEVEKHTIFDITNVKDMKAYQFKTTRIFEVKDNVLMVEVYIKGKQDSMIKMELNQ
ncbi:MAG: hypothetical protein COB85_02960 [Bacteroidetes bacterium]|nr:MAG: hypothetical protein COB85_02960 [Bacteroidota bacterium]